MGAEKVLARIEAKRKQEEAYSDWEYAVGFDDRISKASDLLEAVEALSKHYSGSLDAVIESIEDDIKSLVKIDSAWEHEGTNYDFKSDLEKSLKLHRLEKYGR